MKRRKEEQLNGHTKALNDIEQIINQYQKQPEANQLLTEELNKLLKQIEKRTLIILKTE